MLTCPSVASRYGQGARSNPRRTAAAAPTAAPRVAPPQEARAAGRLLASDGQQHDLVCTSCLRRAVRTACLVLSTTDQCWLPVVKDARLNEQHSGALTGFNKKELAEEHGVEQVMAWRRTYNCPPPAIEGANPLQRSMVVDERSAEGAKRSR